MIIISVSVNLRDKIYDALFNGNKIFLDKECKHENIRHSFYYQDTSDDGILCFYHVTSSVTDNGKTNIKDYPTIELKSDETDDDSLNDIANKIIDEIISYIDSGYILSCDKEVQL